MKYKQKWGILRFLQHLLFVFSVLPVPREQYTVLRKQTKWTRRLLPDLDSCM